MEISREGAELLHADRRTGMAKLIVIFRNFANAPKNEFMKENRKLIGLLYIYTYILPKTIL